MHGFGFGIFPMFFIWFFWVIILVGVIILIVKLVSGSWNAGAGRREGQETAEEILKQRYARGEITKEEYDRMLTDLRR